MFDINENLRNLDQETRNKIKEAYLKCFGKMYPDALALDYLIELFQINIEPNFTISCSRCKKRVINFWGQRLKNWGML
jgi:hypothetical protein